MVEFGQLVETAERQERERRERSPRPARRPLQSPVGAV